MDWLRRNRRRLAVGGGVLGGLYIVGRCGWLILKILTSQAGWAATCKDTGGRDGTAGKAGNLYFTSYSLTAKHQVERTRKANQFSATESTCRHTLSSLMPTLLAQVRENLNTEAVTSLLRSKPGPEEKLKLWERLKVTFELEANNCELWFESKHQKWYDKDLQVLAISQCLAVIVGSAFLAVMLRTQLNVLAGALYQQVYYNFVLLL